MKFSLFNMFLRLGPAPICKENFLSVEKRESTCLIRVAAFAEQFEAALGFYMELADSMYSLADSVWFELQRRTRKKLPSQIMYSARMLAYTRHGALYGEIQADMMSVLINDYWLSDRFRIIGTTSVSNNTAITLADSIDDSGLVDPDAGNSRLFDNVKFILEKQHITGEPYLVLRVHKSAEDLTRELIGKVALRLRRPLLEVGPDAFPDILSRSH